MAKSAIVNVMSADVSLRPVTFTVCAVETAGKNELADVVAPVA
jgi:hypothetical protein